MFTDRLKTRTAHVTLFVVLSLGGAGLASAAREPGVAAAPTEKGADTKKSGVEGYRLQNTDDPLRKLDPVKPRTVSGRARIDATAWYMTGQLLEARNDFKGAYEAYRKAIELDPNSIAIYRALVPLAFSLNHTKEAVEYALKAVRLDPNDYRLLRRLGVHMAGQRKLAEALMLLEKATQSATLKKESGIYVTLKRDLAVLYAAIGQKEKAADAYEVVFDALLNPRKYKLDFRTRATLLADPGTTFERIGHVFFDAKRSGLAVQAFESAVKARKGKPGPLNFNLARAYLQTKQSEKALTQLQKYFDAQLQSKGRAAYQLLADILKALDKPAELIPKLEALAEKDAHNSTLQYFLADQYVAKDRLEDAEKLYKQILKDSDDAEGYIGLASIHRRQNRPEQWLDALAKAINSDPKLELARLKTELTAIAKNQKQRDGLIAAGEKLYQSDQPKLDFGRSFIFAKLAAEAGKTSAAIQFFRFALSLGRERANAIYAELGQHLLEVGKFAEAAKVFQEAADDPALSERKPNFLFRLSQAHEFNGETKAALAAIRAARKIVPKHPLLHYQEAWIHYHSHQWETAIELFGQVISKYPQSQEIVRRSQFSLSNIYVQKGELRKAEEILEKILADVPDNPSVNNDLGYLYADQGKNLEQAEKMIRKAIAAEPENPAYLDSMGWVLYKLGKFSEALPHLEKAVRLPTGSDATIWEHLGDCYLRLQKRGKAAEAWQKALESANKATQPDKKIIGRIEEKLKDKKQQTGTPQPKKPKSASSKPNKQAVNP